MVDRKKMAPQAGKSAAAIALAAALTCGLMPGAAFAALTTGAPAEPQATSVAKAADTTKTVYVLQSATSKTKGTGFSSSSKTTYTVDPATGLLIKEATRENQGKWGSYSTATTNTYNKKNLLVKQEIERGDVVENTKKYTYSNKGFLTKDSRKESYGSLLNYNSTYKCNKSGQVTSVTRKDQDGKVTFKFQYKNGKVVKVTNSKSKMPLRYTYDKKGNLSKMVTFKGTTSVAITYKNTYNKKTGKLAKRISTVKSKYGSTTTTTYKYKAIKVPASMVKKVNAQQWTLLNGNLNFAHGGWNW